LNAKEIKKSNASHAEWFSTSLPPTLVHPTWTDTASKAPNRLITFLFLN
jgi:hypothetical protein